MASSVVLALDFIGTFAFATSGAIAATRKPLDLRGWQLPVVRPRDTH